MMADTMSHVLLGSQNMAISLVSDVSGASQGRLPLGILTKKPKYSDVLKKTNRVVVKARSTVCFECRRFCMLLSAAVLQMPSSTNQDNSDHVQDNFQAHKTASACRYNIVSCRIASIHRCIQIPCYACLKHYLINTHICKRSLLIDLAASGDVA